MNNMPTAIDKVVIQLCKAVPNIWEIYLFGSFAHNLQRSDSDVDLAILAKQPIERLQLWGLAQDVARELNRDVDLVDLRQVSPIFGYEIINSAKRLIDEPNIQVDKFELQICSMYLDFNKVRRELLSDIQQTGRIYHE